MSYTPFEISVSVMPGDIDEQNHVNNTVYLRWVQEVATAHWQAITSGEAQEGIGWVVLRHEIDYKTSACLGDAVVLRTWVGKATRLTFERFTEIRRSSDGQLMSTARTLWCPINAQTGRGFVIDFVPQHHPSDAPLCLATGDRLPMGGSNFLDPSQVHSVVDVILPVDVFGQN